MTDMDKYVNEMGSLDVVAEMMVIPVNVFWVFVGLIAVVVAVIVFTHIPPKKEY